MQFSVGLFLGHDCSFSREDILGVHLFHKKFVLFPSNMRNKYYCFALKSFCICRSLGKTYDRVHVRGKLSGTSKDENRVYPGGQLTGKCVKSELRIPFSQGILISLCSQCFLVNNSLEFDYYKLRECKYAKF